MAKENDPPPRINCLHQAQLLVSGDRQADYGHPIHDFSKTAMIWTAIFSEILVSEASVTPEQVALCMIGVKISREVHRHKDDNIIDMCGYARTLELIHEYYEEEKEECPSTPFNVTNVSGGSIV
jgi:hypothetical protein